MRLGAIDLHIPNPGARALQKVLRNIRYGEGAVYSREETVGLSELLRILEVKLATARPRRG